MNAIAVNQYIRELKISLRSICTSLLDIANRFGANHETIEILKAQTEHIQENFMFVIVGEVNAGKSSFVNALLGANICSTSHEICTMEVQKISYGATESLTRDYHKRLAHKAFPAEILKEITIVDTPGTNSREVEHQVITEKFVPHCNLVVFVFQMDNIHVQSAWELFRKIKGKWSKKVIFILTKSDRYSKEEAQAYKTSLARYAQDEGIDLPLIFVTSAQLESQGKKEDSGFGELREYINTHILGNAAKDKIQDDTKTLSLLKESIEQEFNHRKSRYNADLAVRTKIKNVIQAKEDLANANIQTLLHKCIQTYNTNSEQTLATLKEGIGFFNLTFKSIKSIFGGETTKDWLEKLKNEHVGKLNKDINEILETGVDSIKSDIQYMVIGVKNELDNLKEMPKSAKEMFGEIDTKRNEMVYRLRYNLTDFIDKSPIFKGENIIKNKIDYTGVNIAGGMAAIGTAVVAISTAAVADITGGVLTALSLLVAGGIAQTQKGKFIKQATDALDSNRTKLDKELDQNLKSYIGDIRKHINEQFAELDHHLASEAIQIEEYSVLSTKIYQEINQMYSKI